MPTCFATLGAQPFAEVLAHVTGRNLDDSYTVWHSLHLWQRTAGDPVPPLPLLLALPAPAAAPLALAAPAAATVKSEPSPERKISVKQEQQGAGVVKQEPTAAEESGDSTPLRRSSSLLTAGPPRLKPKPEAAAALVKVKQEFAGAGSGSGSGSSSAAASGGPVRPQRGVAPMVIDLCDDD